TTESAIRIPGTSSRFLDPAGPGDHGGGRLRYLTGGTGAPLVMLHTVRTHAEHFRHLIPLVQQRYTVYPLDLPGMGYSQRVPGGLVDTDALREAYLDELLKAGRRPGYPAVARAVYANLPSLIAARSRYQEVTAPIHLVYGHKDWSRASDRQADRRLLPSAEFTEVPDAGHFIALERPDV